MAGNSSLQSAKIDPNDEYYTQYSDIEAEMNAYVEYNPDVFRDKTILLPCDDPEWSEFTRYFAQNFEKFGIKKLISTSYAKSSGSKQLTIFELESPNYDAEKHDTHGKLFTLTRDKDGSGNIDLDDVEFNGYLEGDGDFRSPEVTALRDQCDIIVTNPPFSLFRDFINWIMEANKSFIILGNPNAIIDIDVFPLIRDNIIWLGNKPWSKEMYFKVPEERQKWFLENKKEGSAYVIVNGEVLGRTSSIWFTNIELEKHHRQVTLDTMAHNLKYNKKLRKRFETELGKIEYTHYVNYDAIDVPFIECIPSDYDGDMGVPVTFMDIYNPEQFEIVGFADGNLGKAIGVGCDETIFKKYYSMNKALRRGKVFYLDVNGYPKKPFTRLIIRRKEQK